MRKRISAVILSGMLLFTMAACGNKNDGDTGNGTNSQAEELTAGDALGSGDTEGDDGYVSASRAFDINGADYVTELCDYKNIPVTITGDYEVTREKAVAYLGQMLESYMFYVPDETKTTVGEGDIVNVDYVGKLDGEPFSGGSAEDENIDVYNNSSLSIYTGGSYIEGFTEALKGAKVGDVIDEDITFPADYGNKELAGKAVVFTFTVNSIQRKMTTDDVDEAFAKEQFDADSVEEMYGQIEKSLVSSAAMTKQNDINSAVQDYMLANCKLELPEDYLAARLADYRTFFIAQNCKGDENMLENFLSSYYNKTIEEAEEIWKEGIYRQVGMECILDAIAKKEGIEFDETGFNSYVETMVSAGTYDSVQDVYQTYGYGDAVYGETYTKNIYVENLTLDKIKETAVVTEE